MVRMFWIATLSAGALVAACKTDKPASSGGAAFTSAPSPALRPAEPPRMPAMPADSPTQIAAPTAPAPPAPPTPPGNSEIETKGLALMQRLADVVTADAKDCEKLAVDIKSFVAENKPLISQLSALDQQEIEEFSARNSAIQAAVAQKVQTVMVGCASNASVRAAIKDFPGE